jgi:hypothetical protein
MLSKMVTQRRKIEEKVVILTQKWSMSNKGFVKGQLGCISVIVIDHGEEVLAMLIAPKTT